MNENVKSIYLAILRDKDRLVSEVSQNGLLVWIFNDDLDIIIPFRLWE